MSTSPLLPRVILASGSAYRKQLLSRLHIPFDIIVPAIDETPLRDESPDMTAIRLAKEKAIAVAHQAPEALIIGSDQVAMLDGIAIGKPGSHQRALEQLQHLRGRQVVFHTALCLWDNRHGAPLPVMQSENVQTTVSFRQIPDAELEAYLRIEQPYDCAGSAKNEGLGIALIEKIETTDPTALTGLPLIALTTMLRRVGVPFFTHSSRNPC